MGEGDLDLLRGTLDLLILKALAWQPMHGYAAAKWVRAASKDAFEIEERALYIALHRLEARKMIRGRWRVTTTGRKAKTYEITTSGRERLAADLLNWQKYVAAMGHVIGARFSEQT